MSRPGRPAWRHTLRGRATLTITAVTVALSAVLAVGVWLAVSHYLLVGRERTTLAQTVANAAQVERALPAPGLSPEQLLSQLPRETGSTSLLARDGRWLTTSLRVGRNDLPAALLETVTGGAPARQRFELSGGTAMAVGVPVEGGDAAYFEVFPLEELDRTYTVLAAVLAGAVLATVPVSLLVGSWATRPALRPLDRVSAATAAVAAGDLSARIDPRGDPALEPIAASFNATVAALEERVRRDARFAADVSHELRTPLTTMLGALALVEAAADDLPEDGREALGMLREEVDRFCRLVADLLEISRADAGGGADALEDVRLAALVREALARRPRPVPLDLGEGAGSAVVRADKRRLERVLGNLLDNADQHAGGVTCVRVEADPPRARLLVDDAGPGIPEEDRTRVFERFARGRGGDRVPSGGAGLGLSLVTRHVRALGGEVHVTGSPDGGARFVVTLPLAEEQPCGS
ncbi:sensor histidine kinase [Geodermatophilus sp. SYSU D00758]